MLVVFENRNDNNRLYYGTLITSPEKIENGCVYVDVIDCVDIVTLKPNWKNQYINAVSVKDIRCFADCYSTIKANFSAHYI